MDASEFFDICAELIAGEPSADATRRLHEVLKLCCAEGCRRQGGAFGNLFSQVDYLSKLFHLSPAQTRDLQDARRHTNAAAPVSPSDWKYDVKAVARLVSAVFHAGIPSKLTPLLPADERQREHAHRINKDYLLPEPHGPGFHRQVCIDRMEFNPDGTISRVRPTQEGVAPVRNMKKVKKTKKCE